MANIKSNMAFISLNPNPVFTTRAQTRSPALASFRSSAFVRPLALHVATHRRSALPPQFLDIFAQEQTTSDDSEAAQPPTPAPEAAEAPEPSAEAAPVTNASEPIKAEEAGDEDSTETAAETDDSGIAGGDRRRRRRTRTNKRDVTMQLEDLKVGMELDGFVRGVTTYGAFIGGTGAPTDGLLHVSQLAVGYVENVNDVCKTGDKVKVRVLSIDLEKGTFSLTMKTAEEMAASSSSSSGSGANDSENGESSGQQRRNSGQSRREEQKKKWETFTFDPEAFIDARVLSITDFGAFCQLLDADGNALESAPTDGLIHISELSVSRVENVSDVLSTGQVIKVRVIATDPGRNRMSLSLKPVPDEAELAAKAAGGEGRGRGNNRGDKKEEESVSIAADMAAAEANQPEFKSLFELAFERAKSASSVSSSSE